MRWWRDQPAVVPWFLGAIVLMFAIALLGLKFGLWTYPDDDKPSPPTHTQESK